MKKENLQHLKANGLPSKRVAKLLLPLTKGRTVVRGSITPYYYKKHTKYLLIATTYNQIIFGSF